MAKIKKTRKEKGRRACEKRVDPRPPIDRKSGETSKKEKEKRRTTLNGAAEKNGSTDSDGWID